MPRRVMITNMYQGATSTLQYIGEAFDTVFISACYKFPTTNIKDLTMGLFKGNAIERVKDSTLENVINMVHINKPDTILVDDDGLYNTVLFTDGLPQGAKIEIVASATGAS